MGHGARRIPLPMVRVACPSPTLYLPSSLRSVHFPRPYNRSLISIMFSMPAARTALFCVASMRSQRPLVMLASSYASHVPLLWSGLISSDRRRFLRRSSVHKYRVLSQLWPVLVSDDSLRHWRTFLHLASCAASQASIPVYRDGAVDNCLRGANNKFHQFESF
jgi:hypothetical protein